MTMKKNGNIIAIVVTYNRCELLLEAIEALLNSVVKCDILIVDNASNDGTDEKIKKYLKHDNVNYLNTGANIGGAGGFNYGMKAAYQAGYEYFWLMDDDTIVEKDTLQRFIDAASILNNDFGFLSSFAYWNDGAECVMNRHGFSMDAVCSGALLRNNLVEISTATFVSFFTSRKVVESVGLPIKDYFIWGDDTEYSLRISRKFKSYFVFNSSVHHKMKENKGTGEIYLIRDKERIKRLEFSIRNDCCTFKRFSFRKLLGYSMRTLHSMNEIIQNKGQYKMLKIYVVVKGYVNGLLFFNPKVESI